MLSIYQLKPAFQNLLRSGVKRLYEHGHMIEGHGGMLDRLDSVCFATPIFFHFVRYRWVPLA